MTLITQQAGDSVHINADWSGSAYSNTSSQSQGILLEGPRTQMLADPEAPATQNVTVTAVEHTLSMTGTGSLTLSGVGSGTATEAAPLTFTPTAGTLTVTVDGSVQTEQLEIGGFASSFFPTTGARALTRLDAQFADIGFPVNLVNDISIKLKVRFTHDYDENINGSQMVVCYLSDPGVNSNFMQITVLNADTNNIVVTKGADAPSSQRNMKDIPQWSKGDVLNLSLRTKTGVGVQGSVNGGTLSTAAVVDDFVNSLTRITLGNNSGDGGAAFMILEKIELFDRALTDQEMSEPLA